MLLLLFSEGYQHIQKEAVLNRAIFIFLNLPGKQLDINITYLFPWETFFTYKLASKLLPYYPNVDHIFASFSYFDLLRCEVAN